MSTAAWLGLAIPIGLSLLYWLANAILSVVSRRAFRRLADLRPREPAVYPSLSLIVPACNEAGTIEAAVASRLEDDYPDLEVVIVDDRSTDATGEIAERLAARDTRVKALHVTELPEGWLGKLNALQLGQRASHGEWLLFSDADVHVAPGTLRRAIARAEESRVDHLAVFPHIISERFWLSVVLSTVARTIFFASRIWAVENPRSSAFIGVGAFNLVRRSSWEKTDGFAWLRLEPADDMGVGLLMKRSGFRTGIVSGAGLVSVEWYPSVRALVVGAERASFSTCGYSLATTLAVGVVSTSLELGFLTALLPGTGTLLHLLGAAALLVALGTSLFINSWDGISLLSGFLFPVGTALQTFTLVRAGILGALRGGIVWRGTLYPSAVLRAGRRVKLSA
jgi:cellulose synthase/poly-beta-1,6-N-acetylglucosamine synthase-like glycosyltransferase